MTKDPILILLVIEDVDMQGALKISLDNKGFEIKTADTAKEAINFLSNQVPAIIIVDLSPAKTGLELIATLKESVHLAKIPIIFITGHTSSKVKERTAELGAHYVAKPFDLERLSEIINQNI